MKKLGSIILLFLCIIVLTSCNDTDIAEIQATNTINYNENDRGHKELYIIEKDEIGDEEDDERREGIQY